MPKSVFGGAHRELVAVLIDARKAAVLNQTELARRVGKDQSYISLIENGQRRVDVIEFIALCRGLEVDPRQTFDRVLERVPAAFDI